MRKLLISLLIPLSINIYSQFSRFAEPIKVIGFYSASSILNGMGDGLKDSNRKELGHLSNACGTGIAVISSFVLDINKDNWGWYAAEYVLVRYFFYDMAYNLVRELPIDYVGHTSYYDNFMRKQPVGLRRFTKGVVLTVIIAMPFNELKSEKTYKNDEYL